MVYNGWVYEQQRITNDNKEQKLSDSTEPTIAYTPCYTKCGFIKKGLKSEKNEKKL